MRRSLGNVLWLGLKELASLARDPVMLVLIVYAFSVAIYAVATGARMELVNGSVGIVDHDRSPLTRSIAAALLPPHFQAPEALAADEVDAAMEAGRHTFVIVFPAELERDALAGRRPIVQLLIDATAMSQAGAGADYIGRVVEREVLRLLNEAETAPTLPIDLVIRTHFNPNKSGQWFNALMQLMNSVTILAIVLVGAAVIREREHGTLEHLLAMPLAPAEVMLAKVWANGIVILVAVALSLHLVVGGLLGVPIRGSTMLFFAGTALYLFSVTSLGILLATVARTMPQFGLLAIPVFVVMYLLSGATTPQEAMPAVLVTMMQVAPSTHFVGFAQAVLYRGAGIAIVWPELLTMTVLGIVFFALALARFRRMLQ